MLLAHDAEPVAVWLDASGAPTRLVYRGTRYRIMDIPTLLPREPEWPSGISHPPTDVILSIGWRATGRAENDNLLVFDLRLHPTGWVAERIFE